MHLLTASSLRMFAQSSLQHRVLAASSSTPVADLCTGGEVEDGSDSGESDDGTSDESDDEDDDEDEDDEKDRRRLVGSNASRHTGAVAKARAGAAAMRAAYTSRWGTRDLSGRDDEDDDEDGVRAVPYSP